MCPKMQNLNQRRKPGRLEGQHRIFRIPSGRPHSFTKTISNIITLIQKFLQNYFIFFLYFGFCFFNLPVKVVSHFQNTLTQGRLYILPISLLLLLSEHIITVFLFVPVLPTHTPDSELLEISSYILLFSNHSSYQRSGAQQLFSECSQKEN